MRWRLFEGDRHPKKESAVLVELGDEIEGIVIPLISRWLDSGDAQQLGVTEWFYERAREAVTRIGEPIASRLEIHRPTRVSSPAGRTY
jgi:hypothetical protein